MKLYIDNLIPRLKQFSENLSKKEIFIEVPWVIIDDKFNQQKYVFKRNGDLVMSLNGHVTIGKWEYLSAARSLLIDRIQDKILLNQNFIDPAVMVLKKDGLKDENFILANETLIPDLNVTAYLTKLYYQKNNIELRKLISGEYLELNNFPGWYADNIKVTIEGQPVPDGIVQCAKSEEKFVIKNSTIVNWLVKKKNYKTNKGTITIEQQEFYRLSKGDFVFQNDQIAPNGEYRLGLLKHITVENGQIIKT